MFRVTQIHEDGSETCVEVEDFTMEVVYGGLVDLVRAAAVATGLAPAAVPGELTRQEQQRRAKVLARIHA